MTEFEKEIALIEKMGIAFFGQTSIQKGESFFGKGCNSVSGEEALEVLIGVIFTCRHRRVSG